MGAGRLVPCAGSVRYPRRKRSRMRHGASTVPDAPMVMTRQRSLGSSGTGYVLSMEATAPDATWSQHNRLLEQQRMNLKRLGKQAPRYRFFLNPYTDVRFTSCPKCSTRTRQRKLPLVIHVDPRNPVSINKTCRYCPTCDLLIAHKDEIEQQLALLFARHNPALIGNDYLVVGTQDRSDGRRGVQTPLTIEEMLDSLHDFEEVLRFEPAWR